MLASNGQTIEARRQSCLVVDDHPAILEALEATLSADYTCYVAQDGATAIALLEQYEIDCILLDLILNDGLNGIELLRRIRPDYPALPVIVMTGYSIREFSEAAAALHVWDYITKPFNFEELRERLRSVLRWQMVPRPCGKPSDGQQLTELAHRARRFIQGHVLEASRVEHVAREFAVSPRQLSIAFRKVFGTTPKEHMLHVRIEKGKELLSDPDRSIKAVALTLGFRDSSHFNKHFRKTTGMNPSEFRQLKKTSPPTSAL